jgi:hypothetical protein
MVSFARLRSGNSARTMFARNLGVTQPGFDCRHLFQAVGIEHRAHGAAIGVAADDDVLHAEMPRTAYSMAVETPPFICP